MGEVLQIAFASLIFEPGVPRGGKNSSVLPLHAPLDCQFGSESYGWGGIGIGSMIMRLLSVIERSVHKLVECVEVVVVVVVNESAYCCYERSVGFQNVS